MQIILIEDDGDLVETIQLGWPDAADSILGFGSFEAFKPTLFSGKLQAADCVILDMQLPDASGTQVIAEIRRVSEIPILILSGWGETDFRADLINSGVDDYVLKPLSVKELHARVARLVRHKPAPPHHAGAPSQIGAVTFDQAQRTLSAGDRQAPLTHAELLLLSSLIDASGRVVPREELYLRAFGRSQRGTEKVLETYISRLRSKLNDLAPSAGDAIQTARGTGYRMII